MFKADIKAVEDRTLASVPDWSEMPHSVPAIVGRPGCTQGHRRRWIDWRAPGTVCSRKFAKRQDQLQALRLRDVDENATHGSQAARQLGAEDSTGRTR